MKRVGLFLLFFALSITAVHSSPLFGYDFTFFKSVDDFIETTESEKIGIDYTGYGFLGDMTSGLFLRLGLQAPYSTLLYTFDDFKALFKSDDAASETAEAPSQPSKVTEKEEIQPRIKEYTFLAAIGPSFRKIISPSLSFYMGLGLKLQIDLTITSADSSASANTIRYIAATDLDIGFRITADLHKSLRIGMYISRPLFTLTQSFTTRDGINSESSLTFVQNIYPDFNKTDTSTNIVGYISLGYTYADYIRYTPMRYIITERESGKGRLEVM